MLEDRRGQEGGRSVRGVLEDWVTDTAREMNNQGYELSFSRPTEDTVLVQLAGDWRISQKLPSTSQVRAQLKSGPPVQRLAFDTEHLASWDSGLLTFLIKVLKHCSAASS